MTKQKPESTMIMEHTYNNGIRSRWYTSHVEAQTVLDGIPVERRGVYTVNEPLRTSPGIWRVDDHVAVASKTHA